MSFYDEIPHSRFDEGPDLFVLNGFNDPGRNSAGYCIGGNIPGNNGAGCNNRPVMDGNARQDRDIGADPHMISDDYRFMIISSIFCGLKAVIDRGDHGVVADQRIVSDGNSALILKPAARVDKDPLPEAEVPPEVRGKGGKQ